MIFATFYIMISHFLWTSRHMSTVKSEIPPLCGCLSWICAGLMLRGNSFCSCHCRDLQIQTHSAVHIQNICQTPGWRGWRGRLARYAEAHSCATWLHSSSVPSNCSGPAEQKIFPSVCFSVSVWRRLERKAERGERYFQTEEAKRDWYFIAEMLVWSGLFASFCVFLSCLFVKQMLAPNIETNPGVAVKL